MKKTKRKSKNKTDIPNTFPCSGCGCCCKRVDIASKAHPELNDKESPLYFPYNYDKNGYCEKLLPNNKCSVYSYRPLVCNVDKLMDYLGEEKKDFYNRNISACNIMQEVDLIPMEFRIKEL